jgi:hypothetical protein
MDEEHELVDRARRWIDGIQEQFVSEPLPAVAVAPEPFGFKLL